ncbi:MAG: MarR family transcriptional regulator [Phycisphaerae bacterium]|nr:MarR family transcriptional regulator [Phycisphaerae bacterium]
MKKNLQAAPPDSTDYATPSPQRRAAVLAMAEEIFAISTSAWQMRQQSKAGGHPDLSETEFLTLDLLGRQSTMTVGQIQRQIGVLPAQMSRIIRSLESGLDRPLISCAINPKDKRKVDVALTDAGRKARNEFRNARLSQTVDMLSHLPDRDLADFMRVIRVIRQKMGELAVAEQ